MEPTTLELSEVTIERSHHNKSLIRISQDTDLVVVEDDDVERFVAAVRKQSRTVEEPETAPEKWYVVLKNSNCRVNIADDEPIMFTTYSDARIYARGRGGLGRTFCPIAANEYERAFGRQ